MSRPRDHSAAENPSRPNGRRLETTWRASKRERAHRVAAAVVAAIAKGSQLMSRSITATYIPGLRWRLLRSSFRHERKREALTKCLCPAARKERVAEETGQRWPRRMAYVGVVKTRDQGQERRRQGPKQSVSRGRGGEGSLRAGNGKKTRIEE